MLLEVLLGLLSDLYEAVVVLLKVGFVLVELFLVLSELLLSFLELLVHLGLLLLQVGLLVVELISLLPLVSGSPLLAVAEAHKLVVVDLLATGILVVGEERELFEVLLDSGLDLSLEFCHIILVQDLVVVEVHLALALYLLLVVDLSWMLINEDLLVFMMGLKRCSQVLSLNLGLRHLAWLWCWLLDELGSLNDSLGLVLPLPLSKSVLLLLNGVFDDIKSGSLGVMGHS